MSCQPKGNDTTRRLFWLYPVAIYLIGVTITLVYAFTTNYIWVSDTAREYYIYYTIAQGGSWWALIKDITGLYTMQGVCLSVTLFPAYLQRLLGADILLFFKLYSSLLIPFLPVVVYFIAKRFTSNLYAFLASVFFMGQVCFLQAPSMARSNIAALFFALSLLVTLQLGLSKKVKFPILFALGIGIVLSHYGSAYASLLILGATGGVLLLWRLVRKRRMLYQGSILVMCLSLIVGITVWYGLITEIPLTQGVDFVKQSTDITGAQGDSLAKLSSRDKIIQAAFGVKNPDGDTVFTFSWATFVFAWLTVMLMSYGLLITIVKWRRERAVPLEYLVLSIIGYAAIIALIVLPYASRAYGIERVYYQMLVFLAIYFVFGCTDIARRLRLKPYMIILPVLVPYSYFLYTTGVIQSITGVAP